MAFTAQTPEASQRRRAYIEELVDLLPIHPRVRNRFRDLEVRAGKPLPYGRGSVAAVADSA